MCVLCESRSGKPRGCCARTNGQRYGVDFWTERARAGAAHLTSTGTSARALPWAPCCPTSLLPSSRSGGLGVILWKAVIHGWWRGCWSWLPWSSCRRRHGRQSVEATRRPSCVSVAQAASSALLHNHPRLAKRLPPASCQRSAGALEIATSSFGSRGQEIWLISRGVVS